MSAPSMTSTPAGLSLGIDFGTTNTVLALAAPGAPANLARFPAPEGDVFAFRSALAFHAPPDQMIPPAPKSTENARSKCDKVGVQSRPHTLTKPPDRASP